MVADLGRSGPRGKPLRDGLSLTHYTRRTLGKVSVNSLLDEFDPFSSCPIVSLLFFGTLIYACFYNIIMKKTKLGAWTRTRTRDGCWHRNASGTSHHQEEPVRRIIKELSLDRPGERRGPGKAFQRMGGGARTRLPPSRTRWSDCAASSRHVGGVLHRGGE